MMRPHVATYTSASLSACTHADMHLCVRAPFGMSGAYVRTVSPHEIGMSILVFPSNISRLLRGRSSQSSMTRASQPNQDGLLGGPRGATAQKQNLFSHARERRSVLCPNRVGCRTGAESIFANHRPCQRMTLGAYAVLPGLSCLSGWLSVWLALKWRRKVSCCPASAWFSAMSLQTGFPRKINWHWAPSHLRHDICIMMYLAFRPVSLTCILDNIIRRPPTCPAGRDWVPSFCFWRPTQNPGCQWLRRSDAAREMTGAIHFSVEGRQFQPPIDSFLSCHRIHPSMELQKLGSGVVHGSAMMADPCL